MRIIKNKQKFKKGVAIILVSSLFTVKFIGCKDDITSPEEQKNQLEYVIPEEVGYSSEKLDAVKEVVSESGYSAVMALYDGKVFFSWGEISKNYWCHSIRKPFLGALYGINLGEGNINLNSTLEDLNIDDIPPSLTSDEKTATVKDLLKSRSGVYHEAAAETAYMVETRPERGSHKPNTFFYYNNWDFNALGSIFEQETGSKIFEEFKDKIADPIGMEDFSVNNCSYFYENNKSIHPAYLFRMSARDMARFGVVYQKNGTWNDNRIIPQEWIKESTTAYSIDDSASGISYGYMWRVFPEGSTIASMIGHSGFYHTGVGVHALVIIPELKLVIVERMDTDGEWIDPDNGMEIGMMIMNAKVN